MVDSPFEKIIQFLSFDVQGAFHVREKVFNLSFSTFFTPQRENPRHVAPFGVSLAGLKCKNLEN